MLWQGSNIRRLHLKQEERNMLLWHQVDKKAHLNFTLCFDTLSVILLSLLF